MLNLNKVIMKKLNSISEYQKENKENKVNLNTVYGGKAALSGTYNLTGCCGTTCTDKTDDC